MNFWRFFNSAKRIPLILWAALPIKRQEAASTTILLSERKQAEEQLRTALARTQSLYDISRSLSLGEPLRTTVQTLADRIAANLPADRVSLILFDLEKQQVIDFVRGGNGRNEVVEVVFAELWHGLSGWVLRELKPALSSKGMADPRESKEVQQRRAETNCGAIMVVPLLYQDKVLGTVTTINRLDQRDFLADDLELLQAIASQVAVTIINAHLVESLRLSEEHFRAVAETANDAIFTADHEGTITYFNPGAERIFGYQAAEARGQFVTCLIPGRFHTVHGAAGGRSLSLGEAHLTGKPVELVGQTRDGREFPLELSLSRWQAGGATFFTGLVRDISERRQAEERQARLLQEVESVNQELNSFAYIVSHDLKAPLRAINSLATWLATDYAGQLDETGQEHLRLLTGRVRRLHNLIDGILEYSRVGRLREAHTAVNLQPLVAEVIDLLTPPANVTITIETALPTVRGEATRLRQVFQNLLDNAIKFMDKPHGDIRIGCAAESNGWKFYVADNGPGIDARHFHKIFQLFQTLAPRDQVENTGVGLGIVKKIIELHGGQVWLESKPGEGSTFYFTLPQEIES